MVIDRLNRLIGFAMNEATENGHAPPVAINKLQV